MLRIFSLQLDRSLKFSGQKCLLLHLQKALCECSYTVPKKKQLSTGEKYQNHCNRTCARKYLAQYNVVWEHCVFPGFGKWCFLISGIQKFEVTESSLSEKVNTDSSTEPKKQYCHSNRTIERKDPNSVLNLFFFFRTIIAQSGWFDEMTWRGTNVVWLLQGQW